jgi:DNA repair exonuclease SbcCD ATPase subunit
MKRTQVVAEMRLRFLAVEHFRCIRSAQITFGPGLNVLHGRNDLGKSSLAEAIRAALLLPPTSVDHKPFIPAGTDHVPKVILEFEKGDDCFRITKTFGTGARGTATLEKSRDGQRWHPLASARDVDGKVREMLSWGIPSPGGRRSPHGGAPPRQL